jgi:plastocyanin
MKSPGSNERGALRCLGAVACVALVLVGCSDTEEARPKGPITPVDPATAGTIHVTVRYSGEVPAPERINMSGTPACEQAHPEPVYDTSLEVRDGKVANAVVFVERGLGERAFASPEAPVVIDQKGCLYDPRVAATMVGQPVEFHNSDREAHNVRGRPERVKAWNFMISRQNASRTLTFDRPEVGIRVGCDIHPWMVAYLSIFSHPYFAVTAADGTATLQNLPPGDYTVAVWHEKLGRKERAVELEPRGVVEVELPYDEADAAR